MLYVKTIGKQGSIKGIHLFSKCDCSMFIDTYQVLKSKPSDIGLVAVASNNLLCLNRDQNIFDSKKRLKAATVEGLELKLTSSQRRQIARNSALLAMFTAQVSF